MLTNIIGMISLSDAIAFLALLISLYTAYDSFLAKFKGQLWFSEQIILLSLDNTPSICLPCFIENSGAKEGALADIRITVKIKNNQASYSFYPLLMKDDYSIHGSYTTDDWWQFGIISLPPKYRKQTYIFFKPLNDNYSSIDGEMAIRLQVRWHGDNTWNNIGKEVIFTLETGISQKWNNPTNPPIQVASSNFMALRENL
jgi:hypothetical protein